MKDKEFVLNLIVKLDKDYKLMWESGDLYFNNFAHKFITTSELVNKPFLTSLEIKDIYSKSNIDPLDNPYNVTYMCEEDYDGLYELQEALRRDGFENNRSYK